MIKLPSTIAQIGRPSIAEVPAASTANQPSVLRGNDLSHDYGSGPVLWGLMVSVQSGEMVAVIGPSGSGKSTLLSVLSGRLSPTGGTVALDDVPSTRWESRHGRAFSYVHQDYRLVPFLSAAQNVALALELCDGRAPAARAKAIDLLSLVDLDGEKAGRLPDRLSGGEQQRVAIARALITGPKFLLADEPTGALDERTSDRIADLLNHLATEAEVGVLVATHDPVVFEKADRIINLRDMNAPNPPVLAR